MTQHVRLPVYDAVDLNRVSYSNGEIVADKTNGTVRLMDGSTPGGVQLLRADLGNATAGAGVTVSPTPPQNPLQGSLWFNSSNGGLYIYYTDSNGSQWVQPVAAPGQVYVTPAYTLLTATTSILGGVEVDGTTITINNGVISLVNAGSFVNSSFIGSTPLGRLSDPVTVNSSSSSSIIYNWSTDSSVYYENNLGSNYTAVFTNLPTTNNRHYLINILINQGATGYYPSAISVNGTTYTINWTNGTTPTPSSNFPDLVSFGLLNVNGVWTVTGNLSSYKTLN
jgi:hypothetical protein